MVLTANFHIWKFLNQFKKNPKKLQKSYKVAEKILNLKL